MKEKEFDYINVIPLVDVMLVLLTIVLTTSTFIATGVVPIELPGASKSEAESLKNQSVEIDRNGNIYLNSRPVLIGTLKEAIKSLDKETPFLIRADRNIVLQTFVDVLDVIKSSGFKKVSLQTAENK